MLEVGNVSKSHTDHFWVAVGGLQQGMTSLKKPLGVAGLNSSVPEVVALVFCPYLWLPTGF